MRSGQAKPTEAARRTSAWAKDSDGNPFGIAFVGVSLAFERIEDLDAALPEPDVDRLPLPWPAAFLAARCYAAYRRKGGSRSSPLPDVYIGAHAAVEGMVLLTRDPTRYRTYFPTLELITP